MKRVLLWFRLGARRFLLIVSKPRSVRRYRPSSENAKVETEQFSSLCKAMPVAACQSRTVWSSEADAISVPSGEKATALAVLVWPRSVCVVAPVAACQSRTTQSLEADATSVPSGEKATALTMSVWPSSVCSSELHSSTICGHLLIQLSISPLNCLRTKLLCGANKRAQQYV